MAIWVLKYATVARCHLVCGCAAILCGNTIGMIYGTSYSTTVNIDTYRYMKVCVLRVLFLNVLYKSADKG
jgi:hypothetical protein